MADPRSADMNHIETSGSGRRSHDPNFPEGLAITPSARVAARSANASHDDGTVTDSAEDIAAYGIAGRIWEAAYALRRYLDHPSDGEQLEFDPPCPLYHGTHRDITAVELGAGAGYVSLHLARSLSMAHSPRPRRSRIILTDLPNVCPLMHRNARRTQVNAAKEARQAVPASSIAAETYPLAHGVEVLVRPYKWGDEAQGQALLQELQRLQQQTASSTSSGHPITHIIVSDCVYFPALLPPLLRALISLSSPLQRTDTSSMLRQHESTVSPPTPQLMISYKVRSLVKEEPFWRAFGAWFEFESVSCRRTRSAGVPTTSLRQSGASHTWSRFGEKVEHIRADSADSSTAVGNDEVLEGTSADAVYVFVAKRLEGTELCVAPDSDEELMSGVRYRRPTNAGEEKQRGESDGSGPPLWRKDTGGAMNDTFELMLLGGISA